MIGEGTAASQDPQPRNPQWLTDSVDQGHRVHWYQPHCEGLACFQRREERGKERGRQREGERKKGRELGKEREEGRQRRKGRQRKEKRERKEEG